MIRDIPNTPGRRLELFWSGCAFSFYHDQVLGLGYGAPSGRLRSPRKVRRYPFRGSEAKAISSSDAPPAAVNVYGSASRTPARHAAGHFRFGVGRGRVAVAKQISHDKSAAAAVISCRVPTLSTRQTRHHPNVIFILTCRVGRFSAGFLLGTIPSKQACSR